MILFKPAEDRIHTYGISSYIPNNDVVLLGVTPGGVVTEDIPNRDYYDSVDRSTILDPWFDEFRGRSPSYRRHKSFNRNIDIYGPADLDEKVLVDYQSISVMITLKEWLNVIVKTHENPLAGHYTNSIRGVLNGRNYLNTLNLVIDFKYDVILARNHSRLSEPQYGKLAQRPLLVLNEKFRFEDTSKSNEPQL